MPFDPFMNIEEQQQLHDELVSQDPVANASLPASGTAEPFSMGDDVLPDR